MKKLFTFLVLFSSLLFSCEVERDLDIEPNTPDRLTVNGIAKPMQKLVVEVSGPEANQAQLRLQDKETYKSDLELISESDGVVLFSTKDSLVAGKDLSLEIRHPKFLNATSDVFKIPTAPDLYIQKHRRIELKDKPNELAFELELSYIDSLGNRNNYSLKANLHSFLKGAMKVKPIENLLFTKHQSLVTPLPNQENLAEHLRHKQYQTPVLIYTDEELEHHNYQFKTGFYLGEMEADSLYLELQFARISDALYEYYEDIYNLGLPSYSLSLFQPASSPLTLRSNISKAHGIIGTENYKRYYFRLP